MVRFNLLTLGVLFNVLSNTAGAQNAPARTIIVGATASGFISPYLRENILGIGGLVGLEQKLSDGISIRALSSLQRGINSHSNVRLCIPDGSNGCLDVLLPLWLSSVEGNALVTPFPGFPVRLIGGVGYAVAADAQPTLQEGRKYSLPAEVGFTIRRGLEITLGRSPRAPRLQFTRSTFPSNPYALKRVDALTILARP